MGESLRDQHLRRPWDVAFAPNVGARWLTGRLPVNSSMAARAAANIGLEFATAMTEHLEMAVAVTGALVPALDDPVHELRVSAGGHPEQEACGADRARRTARAWSRSREPAPGRADAGSLRRPRWRTSWCVNPRGRTLSSGDRTADFREAL